MRRDALFATQNNWPVFITDIDRYPKNSAIYRALEHHMTSPLVVVNPITSENNTLFRASNAVLSCIG